MEVVFIDSEPKDLAGGGIRTYIRLAMRICRDAGHSAQVYTHNPGAYPGEKTTPIGRKAWLPWPFRRIAYRLFYHENVLWEHASWLNRELTSENTTNKVFEFCDFLGYGFFALRNKSLRKHSIVRVHTPAFLVSAPAGSGVARLGAKLAAWREKDCLKRARHITVPSGEFVREMLPWLENWTHVPNPLPDLFSDLFPDKRSLAPNVTVSPELPKLTLSNTRPEHFAFGRTLPMRLGRRKRRGNSEEFAKPQMTALVDVLTVLVFFLLKNFSSEGDIITPSKNLELPMSSSKAKPEVTLSIAISQKHIVVEGTPVALVSEEQEQVGNDIPGLARYLEEKRKQTDEISEFDKSVEFRGKLTIQGDHLIPYWLLQKVLATCGDNGYSSFSLAVMKKDVD